MKVAKRLPKCGWNLFWEKFKDSNGRPIRLPPTPGSSRLVFLPKKRKLVITTEFHKKDPSPILPETYLRKFLESKKCEHVLNFLKENFSLVNYDNIVYKNYGTYPNPLPWKKVVVWQQDENDSESEHSRTTREFIDYLESMYLEYSGGGDRNNQDVLVVQPRYTALGEHVYVQATLWGTLTIRYDISIFFPRLTKMYIAKLGNDTYTDFYNIGAKFEERIPFQKVLSKYIGYTTGIVVPVVPLIPSIDIGGTPIL